ncbi:hypothetical protein SCB71_19735 [Herbiconiux sp. KACC 21604]|uniref:hypothetical protein n=1 Tax=unclassified Herbiconiux TaxID=2618217 RepID=UPI0014912885|nr:hypothetical protein [Herbiconiux sp. SALV-R1]QJU55261.1 hypothetical protein HL652_17665 [Herbiconiux sp. SALV-R1]WPO86428.1 hypothetical protein SCB71_19735 [Herbiconiux sp. KACC 21604]
MKRIDIIYDGTLYSLGGEEYDELKTSIAAAHDEGRSTWLRVDHGEGRARSAEILIAPGIPISLVAINTDTDAEGGSDDDFGSGSGGFEPGSGDGGVVEDGVDE